MVILLYALEIVPEDDKPLTEEDRRAIAEAESAIAREEIKGEIGI